MLKNGHAYKRKVDILKALKHDEGERKNKVGTIEEVLRVDENRQSFSGEKQTGSDPSCGGHFLIEGQMNIKNFVGHAKRRTQHIGEKSEVKIIERAKI